MHPATKFTGVLIRQFLCFVGLAGVVLVSGGSQLRVAALTTMTIQALALARFVSGARVALPGRLRHGALSDGREAPLSRLR